MNPAILDSLDWVTTNGVDRAAVFSPCGKFRYVFARRVDIDVWKELFETPEDPRKRIMVNISANPSKASHLQDDPTMRRMVSFARRHGCGTLVQLNVGAFISTDPAEWRAAVDPVGPDNAKWLTEATQEATIAVASWGTLGSFRSLGSKTSWLLRKIPLYCFGVARDGSPRHPLYLPADQPLVAYNDAARALPFTSERLLPMINLRRPGE